MASQGHRNSGNLREEAKQLYRHKDNIRRKWLDQYGNVSRDNAYQQNRNCLSELFNMLDIVMEICIENFRHTHTILSIEKGERGTVYTFAGDDGSEIRFSSPTTFALRVRALRAIGYDISDELFYDTRILRNETTHGNQTVILQHIELGYDETIKALHSIADALITLDMLDESLRTPTFEMMRVHEGDSLQNGAYTIGSLIGEGGMSRVYKATQKRTGRTLAVKEMKPGDYSEELLRREGDLLMLLHHRQIPQVHDAFFENGTYYIVMDYISGVSLRNYDADNLMPENERREFIRALLDVLSYLHSPEVGLVFIDLNPNNIIVDENFLPHLIDFGLAGRLGVGQELPAATIGYAAPEVLAKGTPDERTDIYSFGYVLRYLYTGLSPWERTEDSTLELIDDEQIAEVINRCTARNPEERYSSIGDLVAELFPEGLTVPDSSFLFKHKKAFAVAGITAALGISALFYRNRLHLNALNVQKQETEAENAQLKEELHQYDLQQMNFEDSGLTDHVIDWKDSALEEKMRELMEMPKGDILLSDVWNYNMTSPSPGVLDLNNCGIQDISAVSEFLNVTWLDLSENDIADASSLKNMSDLTALYLGSNALTDISFIKDLSSLEDLDLSDNKIKDISALTSLSLPNLTLSGNPIEHPELLGSIKDIQYLALTGCNLSDISWLSDLRGLETVYLGDNQILDISAASSLTDLTHLELDNNPLEDHSIMKLAGSPSLESLSIKDCNQSSLSGIESLTSLINIDASNNPISDLTPLCELTGLEYLDLSCADLHGDLNALSELTSLSYLDLHENELEDISALKNLDKLTHLDLSANCISDFSVLDNKKIEDLKTYSQKQVSRG